MFVDARDERFIDVIQGYPFLKDYTTPMKRMERPLVGRSMEMRSIKAAFNRAELSNVILLAEAGSGKAIADDELLPVCDVRGYIRMGDVKVGDRVFGRDGEPTMVVGVYPQGLKHAYKVTFSDGSQVVCNDEHIWRVRDVESHYRGRKNRYINSTLAQLMSVGLIDEESGACRWWIPANEALKREEYVHAVRDDAHAYGSAVAEHLSVDPDSAYALSEDDFNAFLYATEAKRRQFLQPIIQDLSSGVSHDGRLVLYAADGELLRQLRVLLTSIGVRVFASGDEEHGYTLKLLSSTTDLGIIDVEDLGMDVPMTCIKVDSEEELFQVTEYHLVTHNTALVQGAMLTDEDRIYLEVDLPRMIANTPKTDEIADKLKQLFEESGRFGKEQAHEIVLFMDEFHQIVQISPVAVEALKPLLADSATRGIHVVAATTFAEFQTYISGNQPLVERLQRINLKEVDRETTVSILEAMAERYGVASKISDKSIFELIYEYTNRYIPANAQPRKSILIFDAMIGWHRSENRPFDSKLLADVIFESEGVNVAFRVDPNTIKRRIDEKVFAQDFATSAIAQRLQLCVADLNDKSKPMSTFLMTGSTGVGKGHPVGTLIPTMESRTSSGYTKVEDIEVGDFVFGPNGEPVEVLGVFPRGEMDVYKVTFSDGRSVIVDKDHLWGLYLYKHDRNDDNLVVISTHRIAHMLSGAMSRKTRKLRFSVPMNMPVQWPYVDLPVDPYVVGAFIADGCMTDSVKPLTLSSDDEFVVAKCSSRLGAKGYKSYKNHHGRKGTFNYNWTFLHPTRKARRGDALLQKTEVFGNMPGVVGCYSKERRIPLEYLHASVGQRWDLVQGLFDCDGHIGQADGGRYNVSYSTSSEGLAHDVCELLYSLGVMCSITSTKRDNGQGSVSVEYSVHVRSAHDAKHRFFSLPRKLEIAEKSAAYGSEKTYDTEYVDIVSVERLPDKMKTVCLYVDQPDHLYQGEDFVVTHNTEVTKQMASILFGDAQRHLIRIDCTEYANPDSLERFRLELTTRVWERPYCIILLDEVEKACAEVTRVLLSVLDDARLTDRNGRTVTFSNAYVVMTTNAGSEIYKTIAQYEVSDTGAGEFLMRYEKLIRRSLTQTTGDNRFPPELLGRVDCIVPFQPLSPETMRKIVLTKLQELKLELWRKHHVEVAVDKKVIQYLVEDSLDTDSDSGGARAVVSKLESEVTTNVARFVNAHPDVPRIGVKVEGQMASEDKHRVISEAYIRVVGVK